MSLDKIGDASAKNVISSLRRRANLDTTNVFTDTTTSSSPGTGSMVLSGGLGVAGDIWTGAAFVGKKGAKDFLLAGIIAPSSAPGFGIYNDGQMVWGIDGVYDCMVVRTGPLQMYADANWEFLGAKIGAWIADGGMARVGHRNHNTLGSYGYMQDGAGACFISSAAGQLVSIRVNDAEKISVSGSGVSIGGGPVISRISSGIATLVAGTVTVNDSAITANSRIFPAVKSGTLNGKFEAPVVVPGVSFTLMTDDPSDDATISYLIIEP